eukprot:356051-Chlamydomonas_euryale.AAC.3
MQPASTAQTLVHRRLAVQLAPFPGPTNLLSGRVHGVAWQRTWAEHGSSTRVSTDAQQPLRWGMSWLAPSAPLKCRRRNRCSCFIHANVKARGFICTGEGVAPHTRMHPHTQLYIPPHPSWAAQRRDVLRHCSRNCLVRSSLVQAASSVRYLRLILPSRRHALAAGRAGSTSSAVSAHG